MTDSSVMERLSLGFLIYHCFAALTEYSVVTRSE